MRLALRHLRSVDPAMDALIAHVGRCGLKPDQPSPGGTITRVVAPIKLYS